jgi:hypothetical protein
MGQEYNKVIPYDFYESLVRRAFLSFELQLNCWDGGRLMTRARCEV